MIKNIIIVLLILVFALFAFKPLNKLLLFDEVITLEFALSLVESRSVKVDIYDHATWYPHTALYLTVLGLIGKYLGLKAFLLRLPGFISVFLSIVLIKRATRLLKPKGSINREFCFALAIFILSPLVIQGSLVADMDSTFLVPAVLLFMLTLLVDIVNPTRWRFALLVFMLFLIFWLKETIIPVIVTSPIIYLVLAKKMRYLLVHFLPILLITAVLSLLSWLSYTLFVDIDPFILIEHDFLNILPVYFTGHIFNRVATLKNLSLWFTPMLSFLILIFIVNDLTRFIKFKKVDQTDFFAITILSMVLGYAFLVPVRSVIKYWMPIMPMVAVYSSVRFNQYLNINLRVRKSLLIITTLLALGYFFSLQDPIYFLATGRGLYGSGFKEIFTSPKFLSLFAFALPSLVLTIAFAILKRRRELILVIFAIFTLSSMLSLDIWQACADYSTSYYYGERGYRQTINYIKDNLPVDTVIYARKDIAHHSLRKSFRDATGRSSPLLKNLIQSDRIDYAIISDYFPTDAKNIEMLNEKGKLIFQTGNFRVYKVKD